MRIERYPSNRRLAAIWLLGFIGSISGVAVAAAGELQLRAGEPVALVVTKSDLTAAGQLAVDDLNTYLQRCLKAIVRRYPAGTRISDLDEGACVVVGAASDAELRQLAQQASVSLSVDDLGEEGARIKSVALAGKPVLFLAGKTWTGACHAVYSFLKQELGVGFFIDGDRVPSLEAVDVSDIDRKEIPRVPLRGLFYHSTWPHPDANCCRLWSFDKWKQFLDWMRHRRMNLLPLFHDDGGYSWGDVIFKTFPRIEKNDKTLARFITDPTWRTELNHKIFDYARKSGIHTAYNLFYSQVPECFADYYPDLEYHPLRMRNVGINCTQPECKQIMRQYWRAILDTYGIDDSHVYIVCSYAHELPLPPYLDSRNDPTLDTIEVLRELDPQARIFVETWCWKYLHAPTKPMPRYQWLNENAPKEWKRFNDEIPRDIGVAEWDTKKDPERTPDLTFAGRPYIQLTHTTMEGWWPPDTLIRHPGWVINYFDDAIRHGAEGILAFHINANTNAILADLTAEIGLRQPVLPNYYRDYARRRFGQEAGDTLAESLQDFCDAVEMGNDTQRSDVRGSFEDMSLFLAFPGFRQSAEELLDRSRQLNGKRKEWIERKLKALKPKGELAGRAMLLARSVAPKMKADPFYQEYLWELDYVAARFEGIESLYRSHLVAESDPKQAQQLYERALIAFDSVKELFRDKPRYHMAELRNVEPDVPFTKAFLKNWEFRGALDENTYAFHVVWERMPMFEQFVRSLRPEELGPTERGPLDVRPWFEIIK